MAGLATTPHDIDLWPAVPRDGLPKALVVAMDQRDWAALRAQLGTVMDGITTGQKLRQITALTWMAAHNPTPGSRAGSRVRPRAARVARLARDRGVDELLRRTRPRRGIGRRSQPSHRGACVRCGPSERPARGLDQTCRRHRRTSAFASRGCGSTRNARHDARRRAAGAVRTPQRRPGDACTARIPTPPADRHQRARGRGCSARGRGVGRTETSLSVSASASTPLPTTSQTRERSSARRIEPKRR